MQIEYSKNAVKYINAADKPTKKRLKEAVEKVPFGDIKKLQGIDNGYRLRVGDLFVPEVIPEPEELEAIRTGRKDREMNGTISHEAIDWD